VGGEGVGAYFTFYGKHFLVTDFSVLKEKNVTLTRDLKPLWEASNESRLALIVEAGLVCSLGVKADDNWNMKICNKKQYLHFICTFEL
jgi:hypothetical protein